MMTHELARKLLAGPNVPAGVIAFGFDSQVMHEQDDFVEVGDLVFGDVWCPRDKWRTVKGVHIKAVTDDVQPDLTSETKAQA